MHIIIYGVLLLIIILVFTLFVLHRCIKLEGVHKEYMSECARLNKSLDNDRIKLFSMYQDAKAEQRAYQMMREKLEQHLKDGFARFTSISELHAETSQYLYLDSAEADMLYTILSKLKSKEVPA